MDLRYLIVISFAICCISAFSIKPEERKCGLHKADGLMKANTTNDAKYAGLGEFPWTVAIFKGDLITCAGSLIQPNIVLTAANCVKDVKHEEIIVKAGLWDVRSKNEQYPVVERTVTQIIPHPDFQNDGKQIKNDIALLILEKPVELADHISLACLPRKDHVEKSQHCFAAGWGKESKDGKTSTILKKMLLPIYAKEDCEKKLKDKMPIFVLPDNAICAGGDKANICMGDGGAALVCRIDPDSDNRYVQSGITSSGVGCSNDIPGVFTKVATYRDWVDEHVKKLGLEPKRYTV